MRHKMARAAIVACLGIATLAYGALEKHITVRIEGRPVAVRTFADTVGDALQRAGIDVGPRDKVVPSVKASVDGGMHIDVYRAKTVTFLLDGTRRRVVVTGLTIEQVLKEISLRGSLADTVRPSRSARVQPGMTISYQRAVLLTVVHDQRTDHVVTNSATIGSVLSELGIALGARDKIVPAKAARPLDGMTIRVLRVGLRPEVQVVEVPFPTVLHRDRHLEYGIRKVSAPGAPGVKRMRYLSKYVDGRLISRKLLGVSVVRAPQARVIQIGASFPGCVCDRGTQSGKATWYSQADGLSAAHKTLPMGTVVHVVNLSNGKWVNVVIRDRGPYGGNRIIDLSDEAFRRIAPLGTGVLNVKIYW
jgi:uncharacterized protein YabE (DUF348 family)